MASRMFFSAIYYAPCSQSGDMSPQSKSIGSSQLAVPAREFLQNRFHIINTTAPRSAAGLLECGPKARIGGQFCGGGKVFSRAPRGQHPRPLPGAEFPAVFTHEIDTALQSAPINDDADPISVSEFSDWSARERLRPDMADARAGGNAGEAGVGEQGDVLAEREMLERGGQLVSFFHAGAHRSTAGQDQHVALGDASFLDCGNGVTFPGENTRGAFFAINAFRVYEAAIDGRAFNHRSFRREIAPWEG